MLSLLGIVFGIAILVAGGAALIYGASQAATRMGISPMVVGLTVVSIGTSAPELIVNVTGALRGETGLAFGNVVGSNIFNIFFVLGISSIVNPVGISEPNFIDIYMNILAGLLLFLFLFTGKGRKLERWEGGILLGLYVVYLTALIMGW